MTPKYENPYCPPPGDLHAQRVRSSQPRGRAVAVPALGNTTVPCLGNGTVPKAVPALGTHQDTKKRKKYSKTRRAADKPPPDPRVKDFIDWFVTEYQSACYSVTED